MDKKRLAILIIFLVVTLLLGYAIYRVFFKAKEAPAPAIPEEKAGAARTFPGIGAGQPPTGGVTGPGQLPTSVERPLGLGAGAPREFAPPAGELGAGAEVRRSVEVVIKEPTADSSGAVKFYNQQDGKFYRLLPDGTQTPMSDQVFFNVKKVTWSPVADESVIEYPDGANIYYNFATKRQVTLPKHWEEFSFSKQGEEIAAKSLGIAPENRWLVRSKPDGTGITLIEPLGRNADKVKVDWSPNKQVVALSRTGQALGADREEVLLVGLNQENFRSLVVEGRGFDSQWSPTGQKILHSVFRAGSDFKPELWIADGAPDSIGGSRRLLYVNTWASKCALADDRFVYCGVPERLETGAGFAPALADTTPDRLYKIDTLTGLKTEIPLAGAYSIDRLIIGAGGTSLHFTDKNQAGLFSVDL